MGVVSKIYYIYISWEDLIVVGIKKWRNQNMHRFSELNNALELHKYPLPLVKYVFFHVKWCKNIIYRQTLSDDISEELVTTNSPDMSSISICR